MFISGVTCDSPCRAGSLWMTPSVPAGCHGAQAGPWHGSDSGQLLSTGEHLLCFKNSPETRKGISEPGPQLGSHKHRGESKRLSSGPNQQKCHSRGQKEQRGSNCVRRELAITEQESWEGERKGEDGQWDLCALMEIKQHTNHICQQMHFSLPHQKAVVQWFCQ